MTSELTEKHKRALIAIGLLDEQINKHETAISILSAQKMELEIAADKYNSQILALEQ